MRRGTRARAGTYWYSPAAGPGAPLLCIEHVPCMLFIASRARASMRYAQARPARSAAQKRSQEAFEDSGDISIKISDKSVVL